MSAAWDAIRREIGAGQDPGVAALLGAMLEEGVPRDLAEYVAGRLAPARGRGRPQLTKEERRWKYRRIRAMRELVEYIRFWSELDGAPVTKAEAIRRVADYMNIKPDTLRNLLREERRAPRDERDLSIRLAQDPRTLPRKPPA